MFLFEPAIENLAVGCGPDISKPEGRVQLGRISPTLVVEDNYLTAIELSRTLNEWDVTAHCAARVAPALEMARDLRPKLALVDINLEGGFEGLELARELQALYGTKVVFVTAYHVRDLMHRLAGAEQIAVLFKPVEREVLAAVLSELANTGGATP
jgi:DNA-binding response OmpR family regulator